MEFEIDDQPLGLAGYSESGQREIANSQPPLARENARPEDQAIHIPEQEEG